MYQDLVDFLWSAPVYWFSLGGAVALWFQYAVLAVIRRWHSRLVSTVQGLPDPPEVKYVERRWTLEELNASPNSWAIQVLNRDANGVYHVIERVQVRPEA